MKEGNDQDTHNGAVVLKAYCESDVCRGATMAQRLQLNGREPVAILVSPNFVNCTVATQTLYQDKGSKSLPWITWGPNFEEAL